jgi:hypothetical protein
MKKSVAACGVSFLAVLTLVLLVRSGIRYMSRTRPPSGRTSSVPPKRAPEARGLPSAKELPPTEVSPLATPQSRAGKLFGMGYVRGYRHWPLGGLEQGSWSAMEQLFKDEEFRRVLATLKDTFGGETSAVLRKLYAESSVSDHRYLLLALAAELGSPDLLGFMREQIRGSHDPGLVALSGWGLARIGTEEALDLLADQISTACKAGEPVPGLEFALTAAGARGVDRLLSLADGEARSGRLTLDKVSEASRLLEFFSEPAMLERLRAVAVSDSYPVVRVMALQAFCGSGKAEDLSFVVERLQSEQNPEAHAGIANLLWRNALVGNLQDLPAELRPVVIRSIQDSAEMSPTLKLRVLYTLDPQQYGPTVRDILLGKPPPEFADPQVALALAAELGRTKTGISPLLEQIALTSDLEAPGSVLRPLSWMKSWSDHRLVERLLSVVESDSAYPTVRADAVKALAAGPDYSRDGSLARVVDAYQSSWQPSARSAMLDGILSFGDSGRQVVLHEARENTDPVLSLMAWNALSTRPDFSSSADLAEMAKSYILAFPTTASTSQQWANMMATHFVNVFTAAFVAAGTPEDLPYLEKMAASPAIPITLAPAERESVQEALRQAALLGAQTIRLRYGEK